MFLKIYILYSTHSLLFRENSFLLDKNKTVQFMLINCKMK